jgi:glucan phosphorylase
VEAQYGDIERWTRQAILNTANMGRFSSDNAVRRYAQLIWNDDLERQSGQRRCCNEVVAAE